MSLRCTLDVGRIYPIPATAGLLLVEDRGRLTRPVSSSHTPDIEYKNITWYISLESFMLLFCVLGRFT